MEAELEGDGVGGVKRERKEKRNLWRGKGRTRKAEFRGANKSAESWCSRLVSAGRWGLSTGRVGSVCWAREGTWCPPYHQIGELPLLTKFPSLPGGPFGAADNINQSYSDYGTLR